MRILAALFLLTVLTACLAQAQPSSDDKIYDEVRLKLAGDRDVKGGALEVTVAQGVVTLRGKVRSEKIKEKAARLTRKVKGVKKVINELEIELPGGKNGTEAISRRQHHRAGTVHLSAGNCLCPIFPALTSQVRWGATIGPWPC